MQEGWKVQSVHDGVGVDRGDTRGERKAVESRTPEGKHVLTETLGDFDPNWAQNLENHTRYRK